MSKSHAHACYFCGCEVLPACTCGMPERLCGCCKCREAEGLVCHRTPFSSIPNQGEMDV